MKDRFKFRFWDKKEKEYFTCGDIDHKSGILKTYPYRTYNWCFEHKNIIAEQCTGLKDKNGKLIYEGDIVELTRARNYGYTPRGSRLVIKWNTFDCCGFSTGIRGNLTKKCADNCIVIGNIHENSDLIKVGGK